MEWGYVLAATIAAGPASYAAWSSTLTNRRTKTNHGRTIGEHIEAQGVQLDRLLLWSRVHTEQDNDVREALGLERTALPDEIPLDSGGQQPTQ